MTKREKYFHPFEDDLEKEETNFRFQLDTQNTPAKDERP
jgi:hypothetical protein